MSSLQVANPRRLRILIVEDDAVASRILSHQLARLNYETVGVAQSGREAIELASSTRPDLILSDIELSDEMNGIGVCRFIQSFLDVPVVYVTSHDDPATLESAARTGAYGYVLKPVADETLRATLAIAFGKRAQEAPRDELLRWSVAALAEVGDGVIATDAALRVVGLNAAAEALTGWSALDAKGRDLSQVLVIEAEEAGVVSEVRSRSGQRVRCGVKTIPVRRSDGVFMAQLVLLSGGR